MAAAVHLDQPCGYESSRECGRKERCSAGKCAPGGKIGEPCAGMLDCAEGTCAANTGKCASWAGVFLCSAPD